MTNPRLQADRRSLVGTPLRLSLLAAAAAFLFRLPFVVRYDLHFGGDAATCYLMARRILAGHHTLYFYGQDYYGSLDQYVTAFFFWLFGPSTRAEARTGYWPS